MLQYKQDFIYSDNYVGTFTKEEGSHVQHLDKPLEGTTVITKKGFFITLPNGNLLKARHGYVKPEVGTTLELASPPKLKIRLSFKRYSYQKLTALLNTRSTIPLSNTIRYSVLSIWVLTRFFSLESMTNNFQVLAWACGFHVRKRRGGYILSRTGPKYDKVERIEQIKPFFVKRLSVRVTSQFFVLNSFKIKLRCYQ